MTNPDRLYWDTSTFLDYLTGEHPLKDVLELVVEDWKNGLVTMVTSTITVAQI